MARLHLIEFECGCIGFEPKPDDETATLVYVCDGDGDYVLSSRRRAGSKGLQSFTPLSKEADELATAAIAGLIQDGHSARAIKRHLEWINK